ncbi:MAG: hypothetical protein MH137_00590 [Flavobacteriales bacterium]|nr:hypothetical protein [Flavobacteriales bacterium]
MKYRIVIALLSLLIITLWHSCTPYKPDLFNPVNHTFIGDASTFFLPMVITPNGDNLNDEYRLFIVTTPGEIPDSVTHFKLQVKKDGILKYSTEDYRFAWNGNGPSGGKVSGMTDVEMALGWNEKDPLCFKTKLYILREDCLPASMQDAQFGDMIDSRYGVIYNTQETFCN